MGVHGKMAVGSPMCNKKKRVKGVNSSMAKRSLTYSDDEIWLRLWLRLKFYNHLIELSPIIPSQLFIIAFSSRVPAFMSITYVLYRRFLSHNRT